MVPQIAVVAVVPVVFAGRPIGAFRYGALLALTFLAILGLMVLVGSWRHRRSDRAEGELGERR